ncbi:MAG: arylsulfatase, partial [Planctomycetes bacterium]|nr:arylsulfatase [Planctomycetota bacterium]
MSNTPTQSKPNIIWIMADDMGYSDIGCFGGEINTPNLDALAADGLRMSHMYNCARCCPTRASLMTGLYPHQAGVGHMIRNLGVPPYQGYLRDDCATIPELLQQAGFRTLMSGKWHVAGLYKPNAPEEWKRDAGTEGFSLPTQRGFDRYYGTLGGAGSYFNPPTLMRDETFIDPEGEDYYLTDAISSEAVKMIGESLDEDASRPFFLYMAYTAPHWPLHAKSEDIERYRGRYDCGWDVLREERTKRLHESGLINEEWELSPRDPESRPWEEAEHKEWESLRMAVYSAQIESMDRGIGMVVDELKKRGVFDNTLIVFLSDNGGCAEYLREDGDEGGWPECYNLPTGKGTMCRVGNNPDRDPGPAETFMSYDLPWANASNAPFRLFKCWVHEGGISTPLIAHWPQTIKAGSMDHTAAHIMDLGATALDMAGVEHPETYKGNRIQPLEGVSLLPIFKGHNIEREKPIFWEHLKSRAVREGKWKLVLDRRREVWELYDIEADRTELNDLSAQNPEVVERLKAQ